MSFQGWPEEALDFYEGLERNNNKEYWTAHKAIYEKSVLAPMTELTDELAPDFGQVKIMRPYRDIRFSADKSPYKTAIGASIGSGYIHFSAKGLGAGSGIHQMATDQLERYRQAIAADATGQEIEKIIRTVTDRGIDVHGTDVLKKAPRGYPADHPRVELLKYKGLTAWHEWPVEPWLSTRAAKDRVREFLLTTQPLAHWLDANVGASTMPDSGRR